MRAILQRFAYTPVGTLGRLAIGDRVLYTVERPWTGNQPFESCIPQGAYKCRRYSSAKYPDTFEVCDVHGRTKILFHVANYPGQVEGCIGLGMKMLGSQIAVSKSRAAVRLFKEITAGVDEFDLLVGQYQPEYP